MFHWRRSIAALFALLCLALSSPPLLAENDTPPVRIVNAFPNLHFHNPTFLTFVPDGSDRIVVVQQSGQVELFNNDPNVQTVQEILDISDRLRWGGEEGLLGLAFDPNFKINHHVFLFYTSVFMPRHNVVARFEVDPQTLQINLASQRIILTLHHKYSNHNGGMIAFGPDHMLYIGVGDGGAGGDPDHHGQSKKTLLAKILRINPNPPALGSAGTPAGTLSSQSEIGNRKSEILPYSIPPDNPFVHDPNARGEIWCYGMRNPWRFSFDRQTGDLWCGDVGQDLWEEVDLIKKGLNYGWNIYEGFHAYHPPFPGDHGPYEPPIVEQSHHIDSRCVIGGYIYRGKKIPALYGHYIYGDYVTNLVWDFVYRPGQQTTYNYLGSAPAISSFGEDRDGEVYVVSLQGGIYKFVANGK